MVSHFRRLTKTGFIFAGILVTVVGLISCQSSTPSKAETLVIGTTRQELSALLFVATDQKYFTANGLNVTIKYYDTGKAAVDGLLKGEIDLATATEFVVAGLAFQKTNVQIISTISRADNVFIIGRTDKGIYNIPDLRGKRIGVAQGTANEFFLGRFLELHGLKADQITVVNVGPAETEDLVVSGSVDAVVIHQPYSENIKDNLSSKAVIWPAQSNQLFFWNVVSSQDFINSKPAVTTSFLKSLAQAEGYLVNHSSDVKTLIQKQLNYETSYINVIWAQRQFSLSINQALIAALEDEARWMIQNNLTTAKQAPNFSDYIYEDALNKIKPEAVNIIQ